MNHDSYSDAYIRSILKTTKTVALVGASANPARTSYIVLKYLIGRGYKVHPINPGLGGKELLGCTVIPRLADLPEPVDMIDIFRNSTAAGDVVDETLELPWLPKTFWMQLSVRNDPAAARAEAKGAQVVMNRCPKIEWGRLSGEIGWGGINSRVLSSKKPQLMAGFQKLSIDDKGR